MLTQKQRQLLIYIHERVSSGETAPSFDEMKDHLGLKSKSGIHRIITGLVERGFLERLQHRARALNVIKLPPGYTPPTSANTNQQGAGKDFKGNHDNGKTVDNITAAYEVKHGIFEIPVFGKIAAGTPIEAIRNEGESMAIPTSMINASSDHYALQVDGDSMIDAGIRNSDIVIIKKSETAKNGDIVVALIDDQEVTLKRYSKDADEDIIDLIPENEAYPIQSFDASRVKIQGRLSALIRSYEAH